MKRNDDFSLRTLGDISIIISLKCEEFSKDKIIVTNEIGKLLWKTLAKECNETELIKAVTDEYAIDSVTAENDISSFISSLKNAGAIV